MPHIFGFKVEAPHLPRLSSVRARVSSSVHHARDFGSAALSRARNLGRQGLDLGRQAVRHPDRTVRQLASGARHQIDRGVSSAQGGVRSAVMWSGRQVHRGAEAARSAIPADNMAGRMARNAITGVEQRARFTVGAAGGVVNEAVGLVGTAGSLAVTVSELQASPTARAELGQRVVSGVEQGARSTAGYARSVIADPNRVGQDIKDGAKGAWNAGSGFVEGQVTRHQDAFARGEGPETLGMTAGQVATYLIPVGAPARAAATGARGIEAAAVVTTRVVGREGAEAIAAQGARALVREGGEGVLRAAGAETRVTALVASPAARETAEMSGAQLVRGADAAGGTVRVARTGGVSAQDLAAASRQSGREVALYRDAASGERFVSIGGRTGVEVPQGSRLIAHTQPGTGSAAVRASVADEVALARLGQRSSVIIDEAGTAATRFQATTDVGAIARSEASGAIQLRAPSATSADLAAYRTRIGVSETNTVAVARTDIAGLEGRVFEGASPKVLREAGLPQPPAGPISAPFQNPLFVRHAEERVANEVALAIDALPAGAELTGRSLSVHVSQTVCSACKAGLGDVTARSGVLKQLSQRYPELTINVTTEAGNGLTLRGGAIVGK